MVKEKLNMIKRIFFIYLTQYLLNLNANAKYLFLLLLYAQLIIITLLLGVWSFYGLFWHTLIILLYTVVLIIFLNQFIKNIKFFNRKKTLLWIESNSFKLVTPLTALEDKPATNDYNKYIWYLHKSSIRENLKNLNYILPRIYFTKYDPLYVRYLLLLFLFIAIFWSYKNNKMYENFIGWTNFSNYNDQENFFDLKVWYKPPEYTKLKEKLIAIPKKQGNIKITEYIPIKSEIKIFIRTNSKDFFLKENGEFLELKKNNKDNYETTLLLEKDKKIITNYADKEYLLLDLSVVEDKKPQINILSAPNVVNDTSLSFVSKAIDDYGIKKVILNISRPSEYSHFLEENINYNLFFNDVKQNDTRSVENYFYKHLADIIWAGSDTYIEIIASDYVNQVAKYSTRIKIPEKIFNNKISNNIIEIRKKLAKDKIKKSEGKNKLIEIFKENQYLIDNTNVNDAYKEITYMLSEFGNLNFSTENKLFKKLYFLAEIIDEGDFYFAKRNLEQVEQNLFDSFKQNDTDKVSTNIKNLKEKIKSLLDLENENNKNLNNLNSKNIKDQIEELTQQIEDLLKTGTKEGVEEKIQKLKQLSENIKNPNNNKQSEDKQKQDFINKLSKLLNEQEKVMEETFNKAAERGKFEQSSEGSGGKSPKEKQEDLRNTLGNVIREIGASENEIPQDLGRADRAMRQASRDLENGRPDEASNAQGRAVEMIQRSINKINSKEYMSKKPQITDKGIENQNNKEKEYLSDNQNIEYQGTSAGGTLELSSKKRIKNASKIAEELYYRYNEEDRSLKDKQHIKNLLDWY